jgi:hypothetical protein
VLERSDALDRAHRPRSEPRAGAVGNAEIHRDADERDIEPGEAVAGRLRAILRAQKRSGFRPGPFPALALELALGDAPEFGIMHLAPAGPRITQPQSVEFAVINHGRRLPVVRPGRRGDARDAPA